MALVCCYDLGKNYPTYDAVTIAQAFEHERIKVGVSKLEIGIIPGPQDGFPRGKLYPPDAETRTSWLEQITIPILQMLPSVRKIKIHKDRNSIDKRSFGFDEYISFAHCVSALSVGIRPLRPTTPIIPTSSDHRLITITLRECEHWPARNSDTGAWGNAGVELSRLGYRVVIVRDTLFADEPFYDLETDPLASRNIEKRALLYRSASCNMFVSNGPAWLSIALDAPTVIFRPITEGCGATHALSGWRSFGINLTLPNSPPYQRLSWAPETAENIVREAIMRQDTRAA